MPTLDYKYDFGTSVRSTTDPHFKGIITGIVLQPGSHVYTVSYFKNGEPAAANLWDFEIELDTSLGFLKNHSAGAIKP